MKISDRIRAAWDRLPPAYPRYGPDSGRDYHAMLSAVFPVDLYPRAWRYSSNGGPPGCAMAMAFAAALRRMGWRIRSVSRWGRVVERP